MKTVEIKKFPEPGYAVNEAINSLTTNITFAGADVRVIAITSCRSQDGKSFVSMQLMRTFAKLGKKVVLVDSDLRRSNITARYGCVYGGKHHQGLAHYLAGMCEIDDIIYETNIPGAYIVPVGRTVTNSLPLLNSERLPQLLRYLRSRVDYVIVDTPPIGAIIDAAEIAKHCDGAILAIHFNKIPKQELIECTRQLNQSGVKILGTVINSVDLKGYVSRKYYNRSYYARYESGEYRKASAGIAVPSKESKAPAKETGK